MYDVCSESIEIETVLGTIEIKNKWNVNFLWNFPFAFNALIPASFSLSIVFISFLFFLLKKDEV